MLRVVAAFSVLVGLSVGALADDSLPLTGLAPYAGYRAALIEAGWKPVRNPNAIRAYPEVACGNEICVADWERGKQEVTLTLWFDWKNDDYVLYIAPQY